MACTITGTPWGDAAMFAEEREKGLKTALKRSESEEIKLTQMLCKTCKALEMAGQPIPKGVKRWWKQHKVSDEKR